MGVELKVSEEQKKKTLMELSKDVLVDLILNGDKEIERLHSIIKEVREYIEKASYFQGNKVLNEKDILEILDKVDKEK